MAICEVCTILLLALIKYMFKGLNSGFMKVDSSEHLENFDVWTEIINDAEDQLRRGD